MTTPYIAPILVQNGFIGVSGTTPYRGSSTSKLTTLQNQHHNALAGHSIGRAPTGAIQLTLNFDGTKNNCEYVADGELPTKVANIASARPAMLRANSSRGVIASLWGVQTAMLKGDAGDMIAMDSIADYAISYWPGGLSASKDRASNENLWRKAA